jgi:heme exporter protein CcmD
MYFDSLTAVAHMDGHGIYVWLAYAITMVLLSWLLWSPSRELRKRKLWIVVRSTQARRIDQRYPGSGNAK